MLLGISDSVAVAVPQAIGYLYLFCEISEIQVSKVSVFLSGKIPQMFRYPGFTNAQRRLSISEFNLEDTI